MHDSTPHISARTSPVLRGPPPSMEPGTHSRLRARKTSSAASIRSATGPVRFRTGRAGSRQHRRKSSGCTRRPVRSTPWSPISRPARRRCSASPAFSRSHHRRPRDFSTSTWPARDDVQRQRGSQVAMRRGSFRASVLPRTGRHAWPDRSRRASLPGRDRSAVT